MIKIPYSVLPPRLLRKASRSLYGVSELLRSFFPSLRRTLAQADISLDEREYLSMCLFSSLVSALFLFLTFLMITTSGGTDQAILKSLSITGLIVLFIFFQQIMYPRLLVNKKVKFAEKNLIAAVQNMLVQLNSGVSLFDAINAIGYSDYGGVSEEFANVTNEVNAGKSQVDALEELAVKTPSLFFRRVIWQLVNGMKSGANVSSILESVLESLTDEQIIQIQKYGNQLNPLAMFYMLAVVIMPSLGMIFMIVIASFVSISEFGVKVMFFSMYALVVFAQLMFLGIIKSKRPNLMGD